MGFEALHASKAAPLQPFTMNAAMRCGNACAEYGRDAMTEQTSERGWRNKLAIMAFAIAALIATFGWLCFLGWIFWKVFDWLS